MTRAPWLALLLAALSCLLGCPQTRCEELTAVPMEGSYRGGGSLGEQRLLKVAIEAAENEVVLSYTAMDGSQIRARYRITKKSKLR